MARITQPMFIDSMAGNPHVVYAESDKNNKQKKDLSRRSSSGNWIEDRVTWKEELNYKKAMGYM